jgi:excinuclease UvrABC ATPase subunit
VLTVITGVAGSGKSSLIEAGLLPQHPDAIVVDQSAIRTSARATPATFTGLMDGIRAAFAAANGVDAALFSRNGAGACEACKGTGTRAEESVGVDGIDLPCETCLGRGFRPGVLGYTLDGRDVSQVLELTAAQALEAFTRPDIVRRLQALVDVGLPYLPLGQPLTTLSGGERQRLKLARELHRTGNLYVLDEPTTGLHASDTAHLLAMLGRLVDAGNTVIVVEHDLDVVRAADWVVDLGPDGGTRGGRLVFTGTPEGLLASQESHTAAFLRRAEGSEAPPDTDDEVLAMLAFLRGDD